MRLGTALRAVAGQAPATARAVSSVVVRVDEQQRAAGDLGRATDAAGEAQRAADLAALEVVARASRFGGGPLAASVAERVTPETALRNSGVWAVLRLRANLISSLPCDAFRQMGDVLLEVAKPPVLVEPYPGVDLAEHLWSSQFDLDRYGNSVSLIRARNALGLPSVLELVPMGDVQARLSGGRVVEWRVGRSTYTPLEVWHERQYALAGFDLGMPPVALAAWSLGGFLAAQEFVGQWFVGGAQPSGVLQNTITDDIDDTTIQLVKDRFRLATANRDIFVTGNDWTWTPAQTDAASAGFLEERQWGLSEAGRWFDLPGDMIDAPSAGSSITYANITQRNLQALVMNLGPGIGRRERKWSRLLPQPRIVKLNTDALLRMDPLSREQLLKLQIDGRTLAPSEARALNNRPPFTPEQLAEFAVLFPAKAPALAPATEVVLS